MTDENAFTPEALDGGRKLYLTMIAEGHTLVDLAEATTNLHLIAQRLLAARSLSNLAHNLLSAYYPLHTEMVEHPEAMRLRRRLMK